MECYEGDPYTITVTMTNKADSSAIDLTGASVEYRLSSMASDAALVTATDANGINVSDPANGVFIVSLTSANTSLEPGKYRQFVRATLASGEPITARLADIEILDSNF